MDIKQRYRGSMLGLAVGDALGTSVEFAAPGTFPPVTDLVGGGPFHLLPGQWTDDTSLALCLAESLVHCGAFDPCDQLDRYCRWFREGYLSSTGECFDIGGTTATALRQYEQTGDPWSGPTDPHSAGNGSLMRLAPVPLAYARHPEAAIQLAADSSRTTHGAVEAVDACRYYAGLIIGALGGEDKAVLLSPSYTPVSGLWDRAPLAPAIATVAGGSFLRRQPPEIRGSGYVVAALEAALWAFANSDSFADGVLKAVNLGDDADTTAAIYGQLAGAYYGEAGIPAVWRSRITLRGTIERLADSLAELAERLM